MAPALCAAWLACLLLALASGCRREPPEQALRGQVAALQAAVEERDAGRVADLLSTDFVGNGGIDREGAKRLALLHFMRNREVGLSLGPLDIELRGEHATVRCSVVLTGGSGGLLPDSGSVREATSGWRLEDGEWRMTSLAWTPD